jgi:MFS transporter, DHA3 family, tetracycline resistance protein
MSTKHAQVKAYPLYLCIAFISAFGMTTVQAVSGVYQVEVVKLNALQLILVGTMLEAVTFCFQVPTGALADLYSRRFCIIVGYMLIGASYLLQSLVPRFEVIVLAQVLLGAGYTFVSGAEEAWVADEMGESQAGKVFLRATQLSQVGSLAAIPLSLALANRWQLSTPMTVGACILLLMGALLIAFMPETRFRPAPQRERNTWRTLGGQMVEGARAVRTSTMLLCILGVTLFIGLASEGFDRLYTAHFLLDFTLPDLWGLKPVTWFGIIAAGSMLLSIGAAEIAGHLVDTSKARAILVALFVLQALLTACTISFGLVGNFYVALVIYWLARVIDTMRVPLKAAWITLYTDAHQRATVFSFDGMVDPVGQIAGGPIVGIIGERFSLRAALVAVGIIMSPGLLILAHALGLKHSAPPASARPQEEVV